MVEGSFDGSGGEIAVNEEVGVDVMGCGSVLVCVRLALDGGSFWVRRWSVVSLGCGLWGSRWVGFRCVDDGGHERVVDHLVCLVGDVRIVVDGRWWVTWARGSGVR